MDDGELEFSNQEVFSGKMPSSDSMDGFFDELLKDTHACTHTHTCNPPGPDFSHTHTCFHVHTKIVAAAPSDDKVVSNSNDDSVESIEKKTKKRPSGNREAVRKYREKKKARAASLEDEVIKLRALNQNLMKRLQGQATLEAEVARLKCLLVDIRGRIEGEIGAFPYHKYPHSNVDNPSKVPGGAHMVNPCSKVPCNDQIYCIPPETVERDGEASALDDHGFSGCDFENLNCFSNWNSG
ncbi:hypothetical protein Dimus_026193 [Dionaea muscipula]